MTTSANVTSTSSNDVTTVIVTSSIQEPVWWQLNFFSFFVEHPSFPRYRTPAVANTYLTIRCISLACLLPAGLLGNVLTVAVMLRPRMRKQTISLTLCMLAVSDGCCLAVRSLLWVNMLGVRFGSGLIVRLDNQVTCRLAEYVFSCVHIVGSWIVVFITLERMVVVVFPIRASTLCSPFLPKIILPCCCLGPFLVFSYLPIITRHVEGVGCVTRAAPDMLIHFLMATSSVSMVPLTLIALGNLAIVLQLTCQRAEHKVQGRQLTPAELKRSETFRRVTNMVLSVSFAFLATVFPQAANAMMRILRPHWQWLDVTDDVCAVLWDFNYAINFYLYVITGRSVRAELRHMLRRPCRGWRRAEGGNVEAFTSGAEKSSQKRGESSLHE